MRAFVLERPGQATLIDSAPYPLLEEPYGAVLEPVVVAPCSSDVNTVYGSGSKKPDNLILGGIARAHLLRACKALSIPTDETAFTLSELFAADEVIVTSSSNLCIRADRIDGKAVGGKAPELFERLRRYLLDEYMTVTA